MSFLQRVFRRRTEPAAAEPADLPAQVARLLAALHTIDSAAGAQAAESLSQLGRPAVDLILPALQDAQATVRAGAVYALVRIGDPRAALPIGALLQDESPAVRSLVTKAMQEFRDPQTVTLLLPALNDPQPEVRRGVALALGCIANPQAVDGLALALQDTDPEVRKIAICALLEIGTAPAMAALILSLPKHPEEVRGLIPAGIISRGKAAVEALLQTLEHRDHNVRYATAYYLGEIKDPRAVGPLLAHLREDEPPIRAEAAEALGKIGDPAAVEALRQATQDDEREVRQAARTALERLGVPVEAKEAGRPTFVRTFKKGNNTYEVYEAASAEVARQFLLKKKVDRPLYYITVETPEGNWGIDKEGLYLVQLLPWQTDLNIAECTGSIIEPPSMFGLQLVVQGIGDNFIVKVRCEQCGREWLDGVRYQALTVVRCPQCRRYNRVDTSFIVMAPRR